MLSEEEKADARRIFESAEGAARVCTFCGGVHARACERVAEFELYESGKLKRVRFWADGAWSDANVVWPEMAYAEKDESETGAMEHDD